MAEVEFKGKTAKVDSIDAKIAKSLDRYRRAGKKIGFKPIRADGLMVFKSWSMETHFVHGEGRVMLVQNRARGDRDQMGRRVTLYVRDNVLLREADAELRKVVGG